MPNGEKDVDEDRSQRSQRLKNRFKDDPAQQDQTDKSDQTAQPSKSGKTGQGDASEQGSKPSKTDQTSVKDRPSVLMYLPADLKQDLSIRFDELNAKHKREHNEPLEKNRDFYPAVIEAGLTGKDLEDVLDV